MAPFAHTGMPPFAPNDVDSKCVNLESVVGLALFATIFPIATFIAGAPKIGASNASTISTMEPVVAVAIALLLIGEPLNTATMIGGGMVILSVVLLSRSK